MLAGQKNMKKSIAGRKNFFWRVFLIFTPKTGHFQVFFIQNVAHSIHAEGVTILSNKQMRHYSLLQGPQKIFGEPHFGHPWYRMSLQNKFNSPILWFVLVDPDRASWSWRPWRGRLSCTPRIRLRQNRPDRFRSDGESQQHLSCWSRVQDPWDWMKWLIQLM